MIRTSHLGNLQKPNWPRSIGLLANLGKKVIHVGGGPSTEHLFELAHFEPGQRVLDAGCGVGTTAIEIASRFDCQVTAVDIAPTMVERAATNVRAAGLDDSVTVQQGDILALEFLDDTFDRVIIESVVMFVDRTQAAREVVNFEHLFIRKNGHRKDGRHEVHVVSS